MEKKLPIPLTEGPYKKENSWIVWIENEQGKIIDLNVYETFPDEPGRTSDYLELKIGRRYLDIGNCLSNWNEWKLQDLFFKFGFQHEYVDRETQLRTLNNLSKIEEFSETIKEYLNYFNASYI